MAVSAVEKSPLPFPYSLELCKFRRALPKGKRQSPKRVETAGVYPLGFLGETAGVPLASKAKNLR